MLGSHPAEFTGSEELNGVAAEVRAGEARVFGQLGNGTQEFAPEIEALLEAIRCPLIVVR